MVKLENNHLVLLVLIRDTLCVSDMCQGAISYHDSDEDGTDGVSDHPVERVNQEGRDDDSDAAQGISQNVQKDLKIKPLF